MNSQLNSLNNKLATTALFQGKTHYALLWKTSQEKLQFNSCLFPRWIIEMKEKDSEGCWSALIH